MEEGKGKRNKSPRDFRVYGIIYVAIVMAICIFGGLKQHFSNLKIGKITIGSVIVTILFTTVIEYICKKNVAELKGKDTKQRKQCYHRYAFLFGFVMLISYGMIFGSIYCNLSNFGMLGGLVLAISLNPYIGIALHFFVFLLSCIFRGFGLEFFSMYFIFGACLCLLAPFLRQISTMGYVIVIGLVGNGIVVIFEKDFSVEKLISLECLYQEVSIFLVILLSVWISWVYQGFFLNGNFRFVKTGVKSFFFNKDWEEDMLVRIEELEQPSNKKIEGRSSLEKLGKSNYPLLKQLKDTKPKIYQHSKQVAVLAEGAAEQIGIDKQLVYIGGLYHEIGKLYSRDYISEGISIGKQYGFPKELIKLIMEHNVKNKIPTTKEAAVLMLADSVVFLLDHIEKNSMQENKSIKDMIEKIFCIRFEKGELDQSGLTIRDFKVLEHYYVDYSLIISGKEEENDISF